MPDNKQYPPSQDQHKGDQHTGGRHPGDRYTGVAIGFHWLIAALIISMLAIGKWMTELDIENPLRFTLTQWHKSFGVAVLIFSLFRLIWRATHKPPAAISGPAWEKKAASVTHTLFYVLLFTVPLAGWLMVSASPLNIPTVLFQTLPWPHIPLPGLSEQNTEQLAGLFHLLHELAANLLLALVLLHIGAALRHHFILKDGILKRMSLFTESGNLANGLIPMVLLLLALCAGVLTLNKTMAKSVPLAIATGEVRFTATLMGSDLVGTFENSEIEVQLDPEKPEAGVLNATVLTATMHTGDSQVDGTLIEKDWFDIENYPQASFTSDSISKKPDGSIYVSGTLTMKETSGMINFPITIEAVGEQKLLKGGFTINRLDYKIGAIDQPGDGYAGFNVLIEFVFEL